MKIVMVLNASLPPGLAANTAAVLGISLGHAAPDIIGPDLYDGSGALHPGITARNIPVLGTDSRTLKTLFEQAVRHPDLEVLGFNTIAHQSKDYRIYAEKLAAAETEALEFSGLCIKGTPKSVNHLTGSLKLYG